MFTFCISTSSTFVNLIYKTLYIKNYYDICLDFHWRVSNVELQCPSFSIHYSMMKFQVDSPIFSYHINRYTGRQLDRWTLVLYSRNYKGRISNNCVIVRLKTLIILEKKHSCGFIFFQTLLYTHILNTYLSPIIEIIPA